ncbi:MAG: hypothetical protein J6Z49_03835 [Kiritimatiellae bacterium]|nr:hypothetical protein [Kiritimatiellia bacterium]
MKLLVTAGPTREHLDPVRFLSNRSTGKMGFAVARAAAVRGHQVTLVAGPVSLPTPAGVRRIDIVSACDLLTAVKRRLRFADALVMTAAVADWRPASVSPVKLKKRGMSRVLALEPNPDVLQTIRPCKGTRLFVGFAAETGDPVREAERKLRTKGLDLIVANDVSRPDSGFAVDTNKVTFLSLANDSLERLDLPLLTKDEVAERLVEWLEQKQCEEV